jgi:hypothetical protein
MTRPAVVCSHAPCRPAHASSLRGQGSNLRDLVNGQAWLPLHHLGPVVAMCEHRHRESNPALWNETPASSPADSDGLRGKRRSRTLERYLAIPVFETGCRPPGGAFRSGRAGTRTLNGPTGRYSLSGRAPRLAGPLPWRAAWEHSSRSRPLNEPPPAASSPRVERGCQGSGPRWQVRC